MSNHHVSLWKQSLAEALGTFFLVFFGVGSVHAAVIAGAQSGVWQVAIVWAVGIALAIFTVGGISGAHINPAITLAFAVWQRFPWRKVPAYILGQLVGAFVAAALLFALWQPWLAERERVKGVHRGEPGSVITAMCYGEYFPNPGGLAGGNEPLKLSDLQAEMSRVSEPTAMLAEVVGTALLALVVFALIDPRNPGAPPGRLAAPFIGLTVSALISVLAPLTQACFNPARDFGPRLFAYFAGWGSVAIPGQTSTGFFTVYIIAPIVGAILGGGLYVLLPQAAFPSERTPGELP